MSDVVDDALDLQQRANRIARERRERELEQKDVQEGDR